MEENLYKKFAVLSMDIEDWYHLDYFDKNNCDLQISTLDGVDVYLKILQDFNIKSSFFIVGELIDKLRHTLLKINVNGHELGIHSYFHKRPLLLNLEDFKDDLTKSIESLSKISETKNFGYRAPCFSLDRERLNILQKLQFLYDSSKIDFANHPLYGQVDMDGYEEICHNIYKNKNFIEFELSTFTILGLKIPISGGSYFRILPWFITKWLLSRYLKRSKNYFFYIHPYELSRVKNIFYPPKTSLFTKLRFSVGRNSTEMKVRNLIELLNNEGFDFITFSDLRGRLLDL